MTGKQTARSAQALPGADELRPQVSLPSIGVPTWALALGAVAIGGTVMLTMNGHRASEANAAVPHRYESATVPALPPILAGGFETLFNAPPSDPVRSRPGQPFGQRRFGGDDNAAFARPATTGNARRDRTTAPAFGTAEGRKTSEAAGYAGGFATQPMPGAPGTQGAGQFRMAGPSGSSLIFDAGTSGAATGDDKLSGESAPARASLIRNRPTLIAQGEIVAATLETPINSDRPGLIRAIVSRDVRSFDGKRVLIPRGSRLIGEFRAEQQQGRRRVLATWGRLIRPDGVTIKLDSPAADASGGMGIPGKVDTHFLARFANAALQSAMQIGINLANRQGNNVIIGNTGQVSGALGQAIIPNADAPPTIMVQAGAAISVFVSRDLDFSGVPQVR